MESEFPASTDTYLKAKDFQDCPTTLTYKGWDRKANEDDKEGEKKTLLKWDEKIKYCLRYSYPQWATDENGVKRKSPQTGEAFENSNYVEEFKHGYSIVYHFAEGDLESGSNPLYKAFCKLRPSIDEQITVLRTGAGLETKWSLKRAVAETAKAVTSSEEVPF